MCRRGSFLLDPGRFGGVVGLFSAGLAQAKTHGPEGTVGIRKGDGGDTHDGVMHKLDRAV